MVAQAAAAHQQQQQQQKQLDEINRAVMFQRLQQAANVRPGPPMGMVSENIFPSFLTFSENVKFKVQFNYASIQSALKPMTLFSSFL